MIEWREMLGRGVKESDGDRGKLYTQHKNKTATLSIMSLNNILILNLEGCSAECH